MEIISDIPLRKMLGRDFSALTYALDSFFLVNGGENKVYKCDLGGNFVCSFSTRVALCSLCYHPKERYFIACGKNLCNRLLFYDSAFSRMDVWYLPLEYCSEEPIDFVKYDSCENRTLIKKGGRWLLLNVKNNRGKITCEVTPTPDAVCNLTAVCCQAILLENIDVLSGSATDGSYYDLTLPPGYCPQDLCIVEVGKDVIVPSLIVRAPDGGSHLIVCRIVKEYGLYSQNDSSPPLGKNNPRTKRVATVTISQLLFSLCEITFDVSEGDGEHSQTHLSPGEGEILPLLKNLKELLSLGD